jgi:hypothetical protein
VAVKKLLDLVNAEHRELLRDYGFSNETFGPGKITKPEVTSKQKHEFLEVISAASEGSTTFSEVITKVSDLLRRVKHLQSKTDLPTS